MKSVNLISALAFILSVASLVISFGSEAWSRELPSGVPTYIPIGTDNAGKSNSYSVSWLLDTSNQRVVVCYLDVGKKNVSSPKCKYTDLPK